MELETNEESRLIRKQDGLKHNSYFDYEPNGQEALRINPLLNTRIQRFNPLTGVQTFFQDEDKKQKSWKSSNEIDNYFGNINSYTDLSGQVINYELNNNKQVTSEKGDLTSVKENRGHNSPTLVPPPPRYIGYVQDEAGYVVQIDDAGVNLTTQKRHDEDGYNEAYYFVANNGRVYQATYTNYDEMHRQR